MRARNQRLAVNENMAETTENFVFEKFKAYSFEATRRGRVSSMPGPTTMGEL
jgi:hypothetical protein